ncbi:RIPOR family member 3-like [Oncorhynchus clarkii lewisi]|uniref:RIPOR family member 3-like n=1 Tax=Oncorhynchus clarkii lewisi TaxID=490388 RepID=UPI0039B8AAB8
MESPKRRMAFKKLKGRCIAELLPLGCTLHRLASPQMEANHKVSQAASNCLRTKVAFRTKAVVYYTEILRNRCPAPADCLSGPQVSQSDGERGAGG